MIFRAALNSLIPNIIVLLFGQTKLLIQRECDTGPTRGLSLNHDNTRHAGAVMGKKNSKGERKRLSTS